MNLYFVLKFLHLVGATVLLGTGAGIAFFLVLAHRGGDPAVVATVARIVVIADVAFTATAVVLQPLTGAALAISSGYPLGEGWIVLSLLLYLVAGVFWLPVVWMQLRIRDIAAAAARSGEPLPPPYYVLIHTWICFGFPAFAAVLAIFWLMIVRPEIPALSW